MPNLVDVKVIGQILRPVGMRLAMILPAIGAAMVGATDVTVAWTAGCLLFLTWCVFEHARRRRRARRYAGKTPTDPRVVLVDGTVVPVSLVAFRQDGATTVFVNRDEIVGVPRHIVVGYLPPNTAVELRRWH